MISKVINDIATDSMKIKGIKENIINQSSSVVSCVRLETGFKSIY